MTDQEFDAERPTPLKLYRYRPLTDTDSHNYLREILIKHQIYFPSRLQFNDPFDCVFPRFVNSPALRSFLNRRFRSMSRGVTRAQRLAMVKKIDLKRLPQDIQRDVNNAGILSLTELGNNLLIWAHYASSHTGVCLEFVAQEVAESLEKGFFGRAQPVIYSDRRPVFDPNANDEKNVEAAVLTKSRDWTYEREWRIVDHDHGKGPRAFPDKLLTAITFGLRVSAGDGKQICQWAVQGGLTVRFFNATLNGRQWRIDISVSRDLPVC